MSRLLSRLMRRRRRWRFSVDLELASRAERLRAAQRQARAALDAELAERAERLAQEDARRDAEWLAQGQAEGDQDVLPWRRTQ